MLRDMLFPKRRGRIRNRKPPAVSSFDKNIDLSTQYLFFSFASTNPDMPYGNAFTFSIVSCVLSAKTGIRRDTIK